jgi:hypothetical protein
MVEPRSRTGRWSTWTCDGMRALVSRRGRLLERGKLIRPDPLRPSCSQPRRVGAGVGSVLLGLALVVVSACDVRLGPGYPGTVVAPELIGRVASMTTDQDLTVHVELASGDEVTLGRNDRGLQGGPGDLLLLGSRPERWYLSPTLNKDLGCYVISASRAFSEASSVVLTFEGWAGVGVRLPKAPGFDDSRIVTTNSDGRQEYSGISGVSFCSDDQGRISGLR